MYRIMRVKDGKGEAGEEELARKIKWAELVCVTELLEKRSGWDEQDGSRAYTRDESASHKSRVLGESSRDRLFALFLLRLIHRRRVPCIRQIRWFGSVEQRQMGFGTVPGQTEAELEMHARVQTTR